MVRARQTAWLAWPLPSGSLEASYWKIRLLGGISGTILPKFKNHVENSALTALDLLRYPQSGAGLDNIATVLSELSERRNSEKLAALSGAFEKAVVPRLGHLLERLGYAEAAEPMFIALSARGARPWVELDPRQAGDPDLSPPPQERDERWRVIIRRPPENDE